MRRRWGLRGTMAASFLLTTAVVVAVVELAVLGVVLPGALSTDEGANLLNYTAADLANKAAQVSAGLDRLPTAAEFPLGEPGLEPTPGRIELSADGATLRIPRVDGAADPAGDAADPALAMLITTDGRVVASSYPGRYPVGAASDEILPVDVPRSLPSVPLKSSLTFTGTSPAGGGEVRWCLARVLYATGGKTLDKPVETLGLVYVQVPAAVDLPPPRRSGDAPAWWSAILQQIGIGLLVLLAAVPVGIMFGLLSTRRLIGRLKRLASSTVAVAQGDYHRRLTVAGNDEVTQLERNFNRMAEQLAETMSAQRQLAAAGECARIARELHDSISQDLFSLRLLAGGMRKALPAGSPLATQVETMERTAVEATNEMQALLLELRPVALHDAGLAPALAELAGAYRDRLGLTVDVELEPAELSPDAEHALLRVAQEALANAVKHARAHRVGLTLSARDGLARLAVRDDGAGFDPVGDGRPGMGLRLMRERVTELGGTFRIDSRPGAGTTVDACLPVEAP
jgi:signal transduction histidine kinase